MTIDTDRLPPPSYSTGPAAWLRMNLFPSWTSAVVTIVLGAVLLVVLLLIVQWVLNARWGVVTDNLRLFLIGQYPFDAAWRIWLALAALSVLSGFTAARSREAVRTLAVWLAAGQALLGVLVLFSNLGPIVSGALVCNAVLLWIAYIVALRRPPPRRLLTVAWLIFVPAAFLIVHGLSGTPLAPIATRLWGGLLLTFVLAVAAIVLSFPFGVLLALGRRSDLPVVRLLSTAYIEIVRGVPLVTILFMSAILLPFFLPTEVRIDALASAIGGLTLFTAAYVAENVRGGLQAIPSGQVEAANAIGLNALQRNLYIVLPQALRAVIPANVGLFISLLKDTTLVFVAGGGLLELLAIGRSVLAQPEWFGAHVEVYVFISAVFFVLCYTMSQASYRLEEQMGVGTR
jgi:general L-amino acid transport system permease protein